MVFDIKKKVVITNYRKIIRTGPWNPQGRARMVGAYLRTQYPLAMHVSLIWCNVISVMMEEHGKFLDLPVKQTNIIYNFRKDSWLLYYSFRFSEAGCFVVHSAFLRPLQEHFQFKELQCRRFNYLNILTVECIKWMLKLYCFHIKNLASSS